MTHSNVPTVDLVKHADRADVTVVHSVHAQRRPARHRLGEPGKTHVVLYAGYHSQPRRRGLARLIGGGA